MTTVPPDALPVTYDDVVAAAERLAGAIERTPSAHSRTLSDVLGCTVVVKFENLQFVSSFKERGALNKLLQLTDDERRRGVVAMSAGNHAQAVAYHATRLGIDATIVMPGPTPFVKVQRTQELGASVVLRGDGLAEAEAEAERLVEVEGRTYIHPYDDPAVIAGQGTVALEMLADHPDLDVLVVPVGGGGLVAGMAVAARELRPGIAVIGVETERYPSMADLVHGTTSPLGGATIADGIAVHRPGRLTGAIVRALVDDVVTVTEVHIEEAVNLLLEIEKVVTEGAGAAGVAALAEHRERFAGKRVGVVLTGGNLDPRLLASVVMRGLIRNGRLSRLHVEVPDVPGSLGALTTILGQAGANIVELVHQRMFVDMSARSAEVEVVIETLDHAHVERAVEALGAAGYVVKVGSYTYGSMPVPGTPGDPAAGGPTAR
jgi:threonine dehydratase